MHLTVLLSTTGKHLVAGQTGNEVEHILRPCRQLEKSLVRTTALGFQYHLGVTVSIIESYGLHFAQVVGDFIVCLHNSHLGEIRGETEASEIAPEVIIHLIIHQGDAQCVLLLLYILCVGSRSDNEHQ